MTSSCKCPIAKRCSYYVLFLFRFVEVFRQKLGLLGEHKDDEMLIKSLLWVMQIIPNIFVITNKLK